MQKYFLLLFVLLAFCSGQKDEEGEECEENNCENESNSEHENSRSADSYRSEPSRYSSNSGSPNFYSDTRSFGGRERSTFGGTFGGRPTFSSNSFPQTRSLFGNSNSAPQTRSLFGNSNSGSQTRSLFGNSNSGSLFDSIDIGPQTRSLFNSRAPERRESGSTRSFTIDLPFRRPEVPRSSSLPQINFPDLTLGDLASRLAASQRRNGRPEARFSEPEAARNPERQSPRVEYVPAEVEYVQRKIELVPRVVDPDPSYAVQRDSGFSARSLPGYPDSAAEGRSRSTYESSRWGSPGDSSFGSFTRSGYSTHQSSRSSDFFPRVSSRSSRLSDFDSRGRSSFSDLLSPNRESRSSYSRYDGGRRESRRDESRTEDSGKEEEENEKQ